MVSAVVISPYDSECVVLAKVMEVAKEISPDDKKRGVLRLVAGRRCGLLVDAGLLADGLAGGGGWLEAYAAGWRMLAFLGAGEARREGRRRGDGLPGMAGAPGRWAAVDGWCGQ